jgi:mono/diheme cytochrome c family protein
MKKLLKILKWTGIVLGALIIIMVAFVQLTWDRKHEAPYPHIKASTDSAVIERGRYLVYGPAHCATCHIPIEKFPDVEKGMHIPLVGGLEFELAGIGSFLTPNLTPDKETGIGNKTDEELARSIRQMISTEGRVLLPFMSFQEMSDEDLTAIISFLRSQEPVKHEVKPSKYDFLGRAIIAFGILKPQGPKNPPPATIARDTSIVYGKYLANNIGNCRICHTAFDQNTGKQTGIDFAGGGIFIPDNLTEGYGFVSPNLTPDKKTGVMAHWDEQTFVDRFKAGRVHSKSPMPWGPFSRMNESDLRALYRYLHSLQPTEHNIAKTVYQPEEEMP